MRKNEMLLKTLKLLKEWQQQLGQGDRPDLDACIKELEKHERALVLLVPHGEVTALLVAISNHAHSFLVGAQNAKSGKRPTDDDTLEAWERHGAFLNDLKRQIKLQAGTR